MMMLDAAVVVPVVVIMFVAGIIVTIMGYRIVVSSVVNDGKLVVPTVVHRL